MAKKKSKGNTGFRNDALFCFNCGRTLTGRELIPLVSYLVQLGRCRTCKSGISLQYPLVEGLTGLLFALVALTNPFGGWALVLLLIGTAILVAICVYDFRHKIIPDEFSAALAVTAFLYTLLSFDWSLLWSLPNLWAILAGPIAALPIFLIWALTRGRGMGFGDVKLMFGLGWFLGPALALSALFWAFFLGAIVSLFLILLARLKIMGNQLTIKSEIPFAPYLILGFFIMLLGGPDYLTLVNYLVNILL